MIKINPITIIEVVAIGIFSYIAYIGSEWGVHAWSWVLFTCVTMGLSYAAGGCAYLVKEGPKDD